MYIKLHQEAAPYGRPQLGIFGQAVLDQQTAAVNVGPWNRKFKASKHVTFELFLLILDLLCWVVGKNEKYSPNGGVMVNYIPL